MQKTNFAFEAIVHDDASTDNSAAIIREYAKKYPNIIKPIYETKNLYSRHDGSLQRAVDNAISSSSKYIAICEGDDYWTDPLKLQKQVDFLEEHEDFSCCCHRFRIYYEDTGRWTDDFVGRTFSKHPSAEGVEVTNYENFLTRFTWTLTLCYRKSVADSIIWPPYKYGKRDFNLHYHLLKEGKGWCFADYMGVYRKHSHGIWSQLSSFEGDKIRLKCYEDLRKYHPYDNTIVRCYSYWLDNFYAKYIFPAFSNRELSKNNINILCFYLKHCRKATCYYKALKSILKCFFLFLGIKIYRPWKK